MNHLKTLLIFLVLFGVLALYRESIKTNIMKQREEKKNADYNNINPETENFVSEIENDNYHYVPKKIYTRGTGINENGYKEIRKWKPTYTDYQSVAILSDFEAS